MWSASQLIGSRHPRTPSCCEKMLCNIPCRIVLFVINLISSIVAALLIGVGALMVWGNSVMEVVLMKVLFPLISAFTQKGDSEGIKQIVQRLMTTSAPIGYAIFGVGLFVLIISAIGYIGACFNSKIAFKVYVSILGFLVIVLLAGIITYFAMKTKATDFVEDLFLECVHNYLNMETNDGNSLVVGFISPALGCCGLHNSSEFSSMRSNDTYGGKSYIDLKHPIICCKMDEHYQLVYEDCPTGFTANNSNIYTPCQEPLRKAFLQYFDYLVFGIAGLMGLVLVLICFTLCTICVDIV
ncbi:hypothetical protein CRM22_007064 [Opisthorchis felineus]|uniref:Tetraspanin n=1 Tax=Opisthorchis felineus TaxID=147828 RepID=A0A4S2LHZ1_OPIFE|nr:hypothetical protein CRM22_007064 [Opisthorchis felineus]